MDERINDEWINNKWIMGKYIVHISINKWMNNKQ